MARAYDTKNQPVAVWLESLGANSRNAVLNMRSSKALVTRLRTMHDPPRQLGEKLDCGDPKLIHIILEKKAYAPAHVYQALKSSAENNDAKSLALLQAVPLKNRTYALMALGEMPEGLTLAEIQARLPEPDPCLAVLFPGGDPQTTRVSLEQYEGRYTLNDVWPDSNRLTDLLECGADPSAGFVMRNCEDPKSREEQRALVHTLVEAGARLQSYNMESRMASWGDVDDLKYLLAHGQDPSALIFELSVEPLNLEAAQYLVDQGANPTTVLMEAVRKQQIAAQKQALAWGADPTVGLVYAGQKYDLDAAKRMLDAGAMAEAGLRFIQGAIGHRGYDHDMDTKSISFARLMIERGAMPDTALKLPAVRKDISTVRWLLERGADPADYLFYPQDVYYMGLENTARLIEEFAKSPRISANALWEAANKAYEWKPPQREMAKLFAQAAEAKEQK